MSSKNALFEQKHNLFVSRKKNNCAIAYKIVTCVLRWTFPSSVKLREHPCPVYKNKIYCPDFDKSYGFAM